jgi:predicted dithiol-disulfide oxidoreductase (DUF899 family)/uncharacterized protein YndB with AHSA1/START domain
MTVTAVREDPRWRAMAREAEFDAAPARGWQLRADPRQLERWRGPPAYPATADAHDLRPGGRVAYRMTGPEGDDHRGFWEVDEVEPPHRLVLRDGFANPDGTPNAELPVTTIRVTIRDLGGGRTRMSIESAFPTVEAMEQLAAMGVEEGRRQAVGRIVAIFAGDAPKRPPDQRKRGTTTMTTTPGNASSNLPGKPPVVDRAAWQAAREELLVREKAHTREGDAIAAARRRLPMVEVDGKVAVVGAAGPVPFVDLFQGRDELVVYHTMWYDGAPPQGQCEGCTFNLWHMRDAVYLNARGVAFAVLTSGPWDEVAPYVEFMGYTQPWYSVRGVAAPLLAEAGRLICYLREGDRVFLTYSTTGRGNEPADGSLGLLDMTPYGRREAWEDTPEGWPEAPDAGAPVGGHGAPICWYWRTDADGNATWGPTSRPTPQWTRPGATPVETLGRHGHHH